MTKRVIAGLLLVACAFSFFVGSKALGESGGVTRYNGTEVHASYTDVQTAYFRSMTAIVDTLSPRPRSSPRRVSRS